MAAEERRRRSPLPRVECEADLLPLALETAARAGDPNPELVQHVSGTRGELTTLTGSIAHGDEQSYMIAIRGNFMTRRPFPPGPAWDHRRGEMMSFSVKVLVVNIESGEVTDSGTPAARTPTLAKSVRSLPTINATNDVRWLRRLPDVDRKGPSEGVLLAGFLAPRIQRRHDPPRVGII